MRITLRNNVKVHHVLYWLPPFGYPTGSKSSATRLICNSKGNLLQNFHFKAGLVLLTQ